MTTCVLGHDLADGVVICPTCGLGPLSSPTQAVASGEPAAQTPMPAGSTEQQMSLSPDGNWLWSGTEWIPAPPSVPPVASPPEPPMPTSTDGPPRRPNRSRTWAAVGLLVLLIGAGVFFAKQGLGGSQGTPQGGKDAAASSQRVDSNGAPLPDGFPDYPNDEKAPPACSVHTDAPAGETEFDCDGDVPVPLQGDAIQRAIAQACSGKPYAGLTMHVMRYRLAGPFGSIFRVHVPDPTRPSDFYEQMTYAPSTYSDSGDDQGRALASGDFVTVTRYPNDPTQYLVVACSTVGGQGPGTVSFTRLAFDGLASASSTSTGSSASDPSTTPPSASAPVTPGSDRYPPATAEDEAICHSSARIQQVEQDFQAVYKKTASMESIKKKYANAPRILQVISETLDLLTRTGGMDEGDSIVGACPNLR